MKKKVGKKNYQIIHLSLYQYSQFRNFEIPAVLRFVVSNFDLHPEYSPRIFRASHLHRGADVAFTYLSVAYCNQMRIRSCLSEFGTFTLRNASYCIHESVSSYDEDWLHDWCTWWTATFSHPMWGNEDRSHRCTGLIRHHERDHVQSWNRDLIVSALHHSQIRRRRRRRQG